MRNAYGGICYRCGFWVKPGRGHAELIRGTHKFRVQHAICALAFRSSSRQTKEMLENTKRNCIKRLSASGDIPPENK